MGFEDPNEKLFRAVRPWSTFWEKKDGRISAAALIDPNGLSVDRAQGREVSDALNLMKKNKFKGTMVSVTVSNCLHPSIQAVICEAASSFNPYHCEIHGSTNSKPLSKLQAFRLAQCAKIEGNL